jgi:predicted ATPase
MITQIEIENFKCFKNRVSFPLGKLTLLTGINGRGKSTLLQSLLLMRQSIEHNENTSKILINGSCVSLNSFDDIRNINTLISETVPIIFKYHHEIGHEQSRLKGYIEYHLNANLEDDMIAQINQFTLCLESNELSDYEGTYKLTPQNNYQHSNKTLNRTISTRLLNLVPEKFEFYRKLDEFREEYIKELRQSLYYEYILNFKSIHYISADRIGPQDFYPKSTLGKFPNVGARGEFTVNLLDKKKAEPVDDRLCLGEDAKTLITQTEEWLSKIFGGAKLEIPSSKSSVLELLFNTSASKDRFKPANVGFGFHSVLPIIVSGLIAKEGEILIVENPEIHLHPRAQSELTKFLAKVSSCGVQVLVESHSDHILNGLRIAVLDKMIDSEDLSILYFQNALENPVVQIPVQSDGGIEEWPDDFFDQTSKDFERLFGI